MVNPFHRTKDPINNSSPWSRAYIFIFVVVFAGLGAYLILSSHAVTATITGASQAICNGSPSSNCTNPSSPYPTFPVGNLNDGSPTPITTYAVYRPVGLTPSQANKAPAVLVFGGAGSCSTGDITGRMKVNIAALGRSMATENKFIIVWPELPGSSSSSCSRNNWNKEWVNSASQTSPSDEPAVTAIVNAITACPASNAAANQCVDPQRIYADGGSSGGNMTEDIMCDPTNSPKFRGFLIDSSPLQIYGNGPDCPSTNTNFFVMTVAGTTGQDTNYYAGLPSHYNVNPNGTNGLPFFGTWAANKLGCTSSMVSTKLFTSNDKYTYAGPCNFAAAGSTAVEVVIAQGGAHEWYCQDSDADSTSGACSGQTGFVPASNGKPPTNGLFVDQEFWKLVSTGASVSGTGTPPPPPPPPPTSAPTISLSASPTSINSGSSSTLTWSSTNATTCTASGGWSGTKATSGTTSTGTLSANASYGLSCTGSGGTTSANTSVTVASTAPPPVTTGKVALFNSVNYTNSVTDAAHYQIMIMQYSPTLKAKVDSLHAANPNVKILMYQDALYARTSDTLGETVCNTWNSSGGTYGGLNSSWFLKDQSGNIVPNKIAWGGSPNYLMDKGNSSYQQSCVAHAISLAKQDNFDGVYWDDNNARLDWNLPSGKAVPAYPSPASWQAASLSFLKFAEPLLHAQGLLDFGNVGDDYAGASDPTGVVWQQFGPYLDGLEQESYTDGSVGTVGEAFVWLTQVGEAQWAEQNNKYAILHSQNGTETGNTYGLASMLLVANGLSSYSTANSATSGACYAGTNCEANYPEYTTAQQLGAPLGPSSPAISANGTGYGTGVYTRRFANGIVVVNPTKSTINGVSLGATYSGSGNEPTNVSTVSLAPTMGLILLGNAVTPPPTPPNVAIVSPTPNAIVNGTLTLSATASGSQKITSVQFRVDGSNIGNPVTASPYSTGWDTTKITNGTHDITALATDALGNSASNDVIVVVNNSTAVNPTAPSTPQNLHSTSIATNSVSIGWTGSTAGTNPLGGYYVVRNGVTIGQTNSITTGYTDNSVQPSQSYNYQVMAYDSLNQSLTSGLSNTASVNTPAPPNKDTQAPSVPSGLAAIAVSTSQINVSWTASTDNVGVAGYDIYRDGGKLATISTTSFGDTGLAAGSTHSYYVTAHDAAGNVSTASNTVSATTQTSPIISGIETGNVSGAVHSTTGRVLSGARISIVYGGAMHYFSTNTSGRYEAHSVPVGDHVAMRFSKDGYVAQFHYVSIKKQQTTALNVNLTELRR